MRQAVTPVLSVLWRKVNNADRSTGIQHGSLRASQPPAQYSNQSSQGSKFKFKIDPFQTALKAHAAQRGKNNLLPQLADEKSSLSISETTAKYTEYMSGKIKEPSPLFHPAGLFYHYEPYTFQVDNFPDTVKTGY